jgi:hypothetical protein
MGESHADGIMGIPMASRESPRESFTCSEFGSSHCVEKTNVLKNTMSVEGAKHPITFDQHVIEQHSPLLLLIAAAAS